MIPDEVVEEVRTRADMVEVIGEVVSLKRSGKDWKGKCPFHDDRSPSFYVVPSKGFYNCFGCGESGDIFSFLMKRSGMDFNDAVKSLGARYGVEVREVGRGDADDDPLRIYYELNVFARDWFRSRLADPEVGAHARRYLEGRGVDAETAERFGLGFAPDDWRGLRDHAMASGYAEELLLEAGLLTTSERAPEPYDRFRNRIIFPIESVTGKVLGFGGRILGSDGRGAPKYLNSPETPVYQKGRTLYALGWNRNAIRRDEVALVVEGYMDVVALAAGGVGNAVATLGTAMTTEQATLLARYTQRALLLFDSDEAGLRATFRAGDVLLAAGVHPSVVSFPPGEDPDTVIRGEGVGGLRRYLNDAVDLLDRKVQLLDERGYFGSIDRTRRAVDKLLPTLRAVADPALRDMYVAKVSERTGVRRETLEEEVRRREASGLPASSGRDPSGPSESTGVGPRPGGFGRPSGSGRSGGMGGAARRRTRPSGWGLGLGPERQLLLVLLRARELVERAAERVGPEDFEDAEARELFQHLMDDPELAPDDPGLAPEVRERLMALLGDPEELDHTERVFEESVVRLLDRRLQRRREELERELRSAESPDEKRGILEALNTLQLERRGRWNVIRRGRRPGSNHPSDGTNR
ncbi:MAG: DNA primase [Gemmatimonadales bacterium]|nr:MAG: DNA primase [Gemmatimonadales bacterium]